MKRRISRALRRMAAGALLLFLLIGSLISCGKGYYDPVSSSDEEARVIAELGGYKVRYELFYAFFHAIRSSLDLGDDAAWTGEGGEALWATAKESVMSDIAEIYATFTVCKSYGIDPFGDDVDDQVNERVKIDIEGGTIGEVEVGGYGSKSAYLAALSELKLNDSVNRLLHRYDVCTELLYDQMIEKYDGGENTLTDEELEEFFLSDECVRVNWVFRSHDNVNIGVEQNERLLTLAMEALRGAFTYSEVESAVAKYSMPPLSNDETQNGFYISRFGGLGSGQQAVVDAAFSLEAWDTSDRITTSEGVYIVIRLPKHSVDSEYYETHREEIYDLCLESRLWREISEKKAELLAEGVYTELYGTMAPSELLKERS